MERKLLTFSKYLIDWYCEEYKNTTIENFTETNNITLDKFLKFIFFVSASRGEESYLLKNCFKNFYALPLGTTERNVFNFLKSTKLITFDKYKMNLKVAYDQIPNDIEILKDFEKTKYFNTNLIKLSSYELYKINIKWDSYKNAYDKAKENNKKLHKMSNYLIMTDYKYYHE